MLSDKPKVPGVVFRVDARRRVTLVRRLGIKLYRVRPRAYDPVAVDCAAREISEVEYCAGAYETCENADAVAVVTEWNEFRRLDLDRIKQLLRQPVFFDFKNIYSPAAVDAKGLRYVGVGRPFEGIADPAPSSTAS